ncbi:MAG: FG-GAP-like repeat-containing protein [Mariprofundales bacterium]|nr:FG-GAP-like repeat-containing protein [Mariprofundales bacterium]
MVRWGGWLLLLLMLGACRTVVPQPTVSLHERGAPHPKFTMRLVGPQLEIPGFTGKFTDLNQDGHLDILLAYRGIRAGFSLQRGDGAGRWQSFAGPKTTMQPRTFDVADVQRDGQLMVVIGGQGDTKGLQVWRSVGREWELHSAPIESGVYHQVRFADVNADGWPDIVAAKVGEGHEGGGINIWLNDGRGGWHEDAGPQHTGNFVDMDVADVDGDGHLDIVAAERGSVGSSESSYGDDWHWVGGVHIWYGDGESRWTQEVLPVDADAESVTVADVNGDGRLDIVAGLYQHGIRVWLQYRAGSHGRTVAWNRQAVHDPGLRERDLRNSDMVGHRLRGGVDDMPGYDHRLSDLSGEWRRQETIYKGTWHAVRVGDIDGDGVQELVAASSVGDGLGLWRWSKDVGHFVPWPGQLPNYGIYYRLDLGDLFDKGLRDVLAVRENGGVEVWSFNRSKREKRAVEVSGMPAVAHFATGSATLSGRERDELLKWLQSYGADLTLYRFDISGHADIRPIKSRKFADNVVLSQMRSSAVADLLVEQGVSRSHITMHAFGASRPEKLGRTPEALRSNRRVLLHARLINGANLARVPKVGTKDQKRDLFHIDHNRVFKTYKGVVDYIVGPGDQLQFTFWLGGASTTYKQTVQADGNVSLPYLDDMRPISGLSVMELGDYITKLVARYQRNPRVDVVLLKARSKTATIFGQVKDLQRQPTGPGTYYLMGRETLVDFIARTGGPTKDADMTKVQVVRGGKTIFLDLNRAIKQADWSENAIMEDGDTVFISSRAQSKHMVFVMGAVGKAGLVEYVGELRFLEAVSRAGGFTKTAYQRDIRIVRQNRDSPQIIPINFDRFMHDGDLTQNVVLHDKDVVIVPTRPIDNWNRFIADIQPTLTIITSPFSTIERIDNAIKAVNSSSRAFVAP